MKTDYCIGLDLGQAQDPTALAILQRDWDGIDEPGFALRHLRRFPLGHSYTAIIDTVFHLVNQPELRAAPIVIDETGVGGSVVEKLRALPISNFPVVVTLSAGQRETKETGGLWTRYLVPKKELVTDLQLLLQGRRLKVAREMELADLLVTEMMNFRSKPALAGSERDGMEAWREGLHDDLVLATALAVWWLTKNPPSNDCGIFVSGPSEWPWSDDQLYQRRW